VSYLTQTQIGDDPYMKMRVAQCAAQQGCATDAGIDPDGWSNEWRRVWAASPSWDASWDSALARPDNPPGYQPGMDPAVIEDQSILAQVQVMMPFTHVGGAAVHPAAHPINGDAVAP
jgi:hypothetical protein